MEPRNRREVGLGVPGEHDQPEDRRRVPDVFSFRLGAVEELAKRTEQDHDTLAATVNAFIAGLPGAYPSRREHDRLADALAALSSDVQTFVATVNASNAIRERNAGENRTLRLQWPVWVLMGANTVLVLLALLLHHG
jgi:type VI protein secretion system component VasF